MNSSTPLIPKPTGIDCKLKMQIETFTENLNFQEGRLPYWMTHNYLHILSLYPEEGYKIISKKIGIELCCGCEMKRNMWLFRATMFIVSPKLY